MFLSVIIPVYNVEAYLKQCVESVLAQGFQDYEIILVNDGSKDSSGKICDILAETDSRIKVFHKANGGSSSARNYGLRMSRGQYVFFIDSDDYLADPDSFSRIFDKISHTKSDVGIIGCRDFDEIANVVKVTRGNYPADMEPVTDKLVLANRLSKIGQFPGAAWVLVVRRDLLVRNVISFIVGNTAEDYEWILRLIMACDSVCVIQDVFCCHRINVKDSITSSTKPSGFDGMFAAVEYWKEHRNSDFVGIDDWVARIYIIALSDFWNLDEMSRAAYFQRLVDCRDILSKSHCLSAFIVRNSMRLIGVKSTCLLLRKIRQICSNK